MHSRDEDKTAEERLLIDLRSPGDEGDAVRNPNWSEITIVDTDNTTDTQEDDKLRWDQNASKKFQNLQGWKAYLLDDFQFIVIVQDHNLSLS